MSNKQIITNKLILSMVGDKIGIDVKLSIPVLVDEKDKSKVENNGADLGVTHFSEETSELITKTGEAISKELLSKL